MGQTGTLGGRERLRAEHLRRLLHACRPRPQTLSYHARPPSKERSVACRLSPFEDEASEEN